MPIYKVIRKHDGNHITGYAAASVSLLDQYPLEHYDHQEYVEGNEAATVYGGRRQLTKLEFLELIGDTAYLEILAMAKSSVQIEAWIKKIELATPDENGYAVHLDDTRTRDGVTALGIMLEAQSKVSPGWAERVLNG